MKQRDNRLDSLRGLFLVIMTLDHFGGPLKTYSWEPLGYVSAAEGFILLSGFVFAVVYGSYLSDPRRLLVKSLTRVLKIYKYQFVLTVVIAGIAVWVPLALGYWQHMLGPFEQSPLRYTVNELLLISQPESMDILPMYMAFVVLAIPVLRAFHRGRVFPVFAVSTIVWIASQWVNIDRYLVTSLHLVARPGFFNLMSWQLLWVFGLWMGYSRERLGVRINGLGKGWVISGAAVITLLCVMRHVNEGQNGLLAPLVDRADLGPLRLVNVFVLVVGLAFLMKGWPTSSGISWLATLGRNSLQVFSLHVALLYLLQPVGWRVVEYAGKSGYALYTLVIVAGLYVAAVVYERHLADFSLSAWRSVRGGDIDRSMIAGR